MKSIRHLISKETKPAYEIGKALHLSIWLTQEFEDILRKSTQKDCPWKLGQYMALQESIDLVANIRSTCEHLLDHAEELVSILEEING